MRLHANVKLVVACKYLQTISWLLINHNILFLYILNRGDIDNINHVCTLVLKLKNNGGFNLMSQCFQLYSPLLYNQYLLKAHMHTQAYLPCHSASQLYVVTGTE